MIEAVIMMEVNNNDTCNCLLASKNLNSRHSKDLSWTKTIWIFALTFVMLLIESTVECSWRSGDSYKERESEEPQHISDSIYNHRPYVPLTSRTRNNHNSCLLGGEYLRGFTLEGGTKAGNFTQIGKAETLSECAALCCHRSECEQAVFLTHPKTGYQSCFQVQCHEHSTCKAVSDRDSIYKPDLFRRGTSGNHHRKGFFIPILIFKKNCYFTVKQTLEIISV